MKSGNENPGIPPKEWFYKIRKEIVEQYPDRSKEDIDRITAGIWHDYSEATRKKLLKRYEGNPREKKRKEQLTILVDIPEAGEIKPFTTRKDMLKIIEEWAKEKGLPPMTKKEKERYLNKKSNQKGNPENKKADVLEKILPDLDMFPLPPVPKFISDKIKEG